MHSTINHAITQRGVMLHLRIARGGVGKVPLSNLLDASRLSVCIAIKIGTK